MDRTSQLIGDQLFGGSIEERIIICTKVYDEKFLNAPAQKLGESLDAKPSRLAKITGSANVASKDKAFSGERYLCVTGE